MTILHGVLDLQTKSVRHLIDSQHNSFDRLHMISFDERMDYNMMDLLMRRCRLNNEPRPLGDDDARAPPARLVPPRGPGRPEADDEASFAALRRWGHSRVPVYRGRRNNIVGLLLGKEQVRAPPISVTSPPRPHLNLA